MKVVERTRDRLVIEDFAWRFGLLFFVAAIGLGWMLFRDGAPMWQSILAIGGFGLVGWVRAHRLLVVFDRGEGLVRIEERRVGWHRCRSAALAEITAVDLVEWRAVTDPATWRIELTMRGGPNLALQWEFTSHDEQYRPIAAAIGEFLDAPVVEREGRD